jgi:hypothetical protein
VSFRIFLLGLCLAVPAVQAQETVAPETAAEAVPAPAAETGATRVPLDPAAIRSVGTPRSKEERDDMAARAAQLQSESTLRKEEANKVHEAAKTGCWKKFLVSACLEDARTAHRKELSMAKRQEREAQTLERNVRKYDALERARVRDEENAQREAENAKKAEKFRAKRALEADQAGKPN